MGSSTRRSVQVRAKRRKLVLLRPGVWLATLSTTVGLATGMFTLRDAIFPNESGRAEASVQDFQRSVGEICQDLNSAARVQARDTRRVGVLLRAASTTLAQRNVLLDGVRRSLARSNLQLSRLRGLEAPKPLAATHRATVTAWSRNVERVLSYAQRLDEVATRRQLGAAIKVLADDRPAIARDGITLHAGLMRLGVRECRFDDPIVSKTITLPALPGRAQPHRSVNTPEATNRSSDATQPAPSAGAAPLAPSVNLPAAPTPSSSGAPPNRVNPPSADAPIASGGGDD
jgi:hypothetical protein